MSCGCANRLERILQRLHYTLEWAPRSGMPHVKERVWKHVSGHQILRDDVRKHHTKIFISVLYHLILRIL